MIRFIVFTSIFYLQAITLYGQETKVSYYPRSKYDSIKDYQYRMWRADAEVYLKCKEYRIKEWDYDNKLIEHNFYRYKSHGDKSDAIFVLVIFIVLTGIFFSAAQFYMGYKKHSDYYKHIQHFSQENKVKSDPVEVEGDPVSKLKVNKDGIELSSSILGVVILALSLVFFYLYLTIVYPLKSSEDNNSNKPFIEIKK